MVGCGVLWNSTGWRGGGQPSPQGSEVVCHVPANHLQVGVEAGADVPCLLSGGCHVGEDLMALAAGVPTAEQEAVLLLLSEHVLPILLGGDVCLVDLLLLGEGGGHGVQVWNLFSIAGRGHPSRCPVGNQYPNQVSSSPASMPSMPQRSAVPYSCRNSFTLP